MNNIYNSLELGKSYNREAVHDIFDSDTKFTPQTGSWGLHGIVRIKPNHASGSTKSYVFFVTYGKAQGDHQFDEGITSDGTLTWQSQPRQDFENSTIKDFISHQPDQNSIHLFLRAKGGLPYQYLGRLGYVTHDPAREKPVYFQWKLLDWENGLKEKVDLKLLSGKSSHEYHFPPPKPSILRQNQTPKNAKKIVFPLTSHSSTWFSETVLVKGLDKSAFLHHGTAVPMEMLAFWGGPINESDDRKIELSYRGIIYEAHFEKDAHGRTRLFWQVDFANTLHGVFPKVYDAHLIDQSIDDIPQIRFEKTGDNTYHVEFINDRIIDQDTDLINSQDQNQYRDGRIVKSNGTRYERDPRNRRLAIKIHGTVCAVCGFDFGKTYGLMGDGFIEIHHKNPLYQNDAEINIDPAMDLIPLCPNCHRMIHRDRSRVITVDDLKRIYNSKAEQSEYFI
ncbi:MAG: DUF3427 domain-containing protein [Eubacteriales bacterium]|nr:DUF3427 domain-containing protein [Eubacteriales bacterium]